MYSVGTNPLLKGLNFETIYLYSHTYACADILNTFHLYIYLSNATLFLLLNFNLFNVHYKL